MIVREAETFEPSTEIEHDGVKHTVARDLGDSVEPRHTRGLPPVARRWGPAHRGREYGHDGEVRSGVGADAITTDLMIT
jgi:hypothetical protein